jgi:hypothetical protein
MKKLINILLMIVLIVSIIQLSACRSQKLKTSEVLVSNRSSDQDSSAVTQVAKASEWQVKGNTLEKVDGSSKIVLSGAVSISLSPTQEIIATADHAEVVTKVKATKQESIQESKKESFDSLHLLNNQKTEVIENTSEITTLDKEVKSSGFAWGVVWGSLILLLGVLLYLAKKGVFR